MRNSRRIAILKGIAALISVMLFINMIRIVQKKKEKRKRMTVLADE